MSLATAADSSPISRAHVRLCVGLWIEFLATFGLLIVSLAVGTLALPSMLVGTLARDGAERRTHMLAAGLVVLGWCGLLGVVRLLLLVCWRRTHDQHARLTLSGVVAGALPVVGFAYLDIRHGLTIGLAAVWLYWLPLAATAHFLYLARGPLFTRPPAR